MLFDLQGKRRRVVQATYLTLAVLMGGGLVLFGIGSESSGGLFDAFSGGGGDSGNQVTEDRVDRNEDKVAANPRAEAPRKELVRDYYSLAIAQTPSGGSVPQDAQDELRRASLHWNSYLDLEADKPDPSLARVAVQLYDVTALNQPKDAMRAARIIAADGKDPQSYLLLVQYALQAGDKRTEKLASQKVLDLVPKGQRKQAKKEIEELRGQVIAQQLQQQGDVKIDGAGAPAGGGQAGGSGGK